MADFDPELVERVAKAMFLAGGMAADWDNVTSQGAREDRDYFRDLARAALAAYNPPEPRTLTPSMDDQLKELGRQALREGWEEDSPLWPGSAVSRLIGLLQEHYRLLPAGGVVTQQHGTLRDIGDDSAGVIARVPRGWTGANYTRTVISWPEDHGPNDNWAIYYGPWTWNGVSP